jgi:2-polyprenyl-6-methoxyphenol hydroxylase-like FAD-dependent oxidoreductase
MNAAAIDVLVVGAGPTGLLLAAELVRHGVACRIIDQNPSPLSWDRATVVHPRTLEIFDSIGIVEPLLAAGVKQRIARVHSGGSVLGEIDLSQCGSRYGFNIGVSEEVTESILIDYLRGRGGEVHRSSNLVDLREQDDGLVATIAHGDATEQVVAKWVVGCDGIHSEVRKAAGIELDGQDIARPWAVFDATIAGSSDTYEMNCAYFDDVPVFLTALPKKTWRAYVRPTSADSDLVKDAMSTVSRYLPAGRFENVANPKRFHCQSRIARRFRSGRILLAGDAAHLCTPSQGHGMNSGLQDAFNLAWKLSLVCRGRASDALLDSYEAERRPVAKLIVGEGDEVEQAQMLTDPADRRTRNDAIRAKFAGSATRHSEAVAEAELDVDYGASPIVMGGKRASLAPGQRVPDTIVFRSGDGKISRLNSLTNGGGHVALLIGDASSQQEKLARLEDEIRLACGKDIVETVLTLSTEPNGRYPHLQFLEPAGDTFSAKEFSAVVIRPDGHVGLRADREPVEATEAYLARLKNPAPMGGNGKAGGTSA